MIDAGNALACDKRLAFKPQLVGAHERRQTDFVDQIIAMSVGGMTAPEMQRFLAETHSLDAPVEQITRLSDVLSAQVSAWRDQPLQAMYPLVYFDTLSVQVKDQGVVGHKTAHLAVGMRSDGAICWVSGLSTPMKLHSGRWCSMISRPEGSGSS